MSEHYKRVRNEYRNLLAESGFFKKPSKDDFKAFKRQGVRLLGLPISRALIESGEIEDVAEFFKDIEVVKSYFKNAVALTIDGYDDDKRELFEIEEVVQWVRKLAFEVPQIFYYLNEEICWSYVKACISKEAKVVNTNERMSVIEIAERDALGQGVPVFRIELTIEGHVLLDIVSNIKRLGSRIGDLNGAYIVANKIESSFENFKW